MPQDDWVVFNYKIDTRGHIAEVQLQRWDLGESPAVEYLRWYDLNGDVTDSTINYDEPYLYPNNVLGLRIDSRGHVLAVLAYGEDGDPYHWYDLDGGDLEAGPAEFVQIRDLRIDTRGHVRAVMLTDNKWYDLDGEEI